MKVFYTNNEIFCGKYTTMELVLNFLTLYYPEIYSMSFEDKQTYIKNRFLESKQEYSTICDRCKADEYCTNLNCFYKHNIIFHLLCFEIYLYINNFFPNYDITEKICIVLVESN